jgi:FAD/FMN-containing dehydrogenase
MTERTTIQIPGFRGAVITPQHHGYDRARAVWNGTVDRRPRVIARCGGTADVAAAVRFARDRDLEIAVRGGGHNVAGTAVCDDGIVIDLSAMRAVSVDPVERTALVQGGALWGDVDHETQAHGLATTGGIISHTGVGGVGLGGGIGWLMRKHGLTVDNLVAAEVVTADGEIVRASINEHPDLFWALRGGGGNFGVVSSFRFALHPVGPTVMAGPVFWAAEDTTDVLRFYRDFLTDAPDELGNVVRLGTIPPLPMVDEDLYFRPALAVASCYAGSVEDGERAVGRSASSGRHSSTSSDPRDTSTTKAASTTPSPTAGATTGRPRASPACPTRSSTSSPCMPMTPPRRGRTWRCSTWVAR